MTMLDTVIPMPSSSRKQSRKLVGMAKPTSSAARVPSAPSTTIITSAMAVSTEPSSCLTMLSTMRLWSLLAETVTAARSSGGQSASACATTARTSVAVSIRLKPLRLTTCSATVLSPLKRAVPSRSSKVRLMVASSPSVTTRSPFTFTGRS